MIPPFLPELALSRDMIRNSNIDGGKGQEGKRSMYIKKQNTKGWTRKPVVKWKHFRKIYFKICGAFSLLLWKNWYCCHVNFHFFGWLICKIFKVYKWHDFSIENRTCWNLFLFTNNLNWKCSFSKLFRE